MNTNLKIKWPDATTYFLTGSTFLHYPYFNSFDKKLIVLKQIKKIKDKFNIKKVVYSIAINHYHLKLYLEKGADLSIVKKYMHGGTSFEYHRLYPFCRYQEMWQPPKALCINSSEIDWKVTGYIVGNLLKHKEVGKIDDLNGNIFTSYDALVQEYGSRVIKDLIYSVINANENAFNNIDFIELRNLKPSKDGFTPAEAG